MKNLITCDWHIGNISDSWLEDNGLEFKINETFRQIDFMIDYCIKNRMRIIVAGDIYNGKRPLPLYERLLIERLNRLEEAGVETIILRGNHCASNSSDSGLAPLRKIKFKNIKVVEAVTGIQLGKINWIFVPHLTRSELGVKFDEEREEIIQGALQERVNKAMKDRNIIVGHLQYRGAVTGSEEFLLEGGINFFPDVDKKKVMKVFLGHIHKFQLIKWGGVEIIYPGSVVRCDFGEREEDKGFIVYDDEKDDWEFETLKTVEYKQINIDLVEKDTVDLDEAKIKKAASGKILKLVVSVSEKNRKKVSMDDLTRAFNKYGYVTKTETKVVRDNVEKIEQKSLDPAVVLKDYVKRNFEGKEIAARLLKKGMTIIDKVREEYEV